MMITLNVEACLGPVQHPFMSRSWASLLDATLHHRRFSFTLVLGMYISLGEWENDGALASSLHFEGTMSKKTAGRNAMSYDARWVIHVYVGFMDMLTASGRTRWMDAIFPVNLSPTNVIRRLAPSER